MAAHGTAAGYVLMGTVDSVDELLAIDEQPGGVRARAPARAGDALLGGETTVQTAEQAAQLMRDQLPFHVADPEGPLVRALLENVGEIVFRPEVLRHFASGGEYGLVDNRERLSELGYPCSCSRASSTARRLPPRRTGWRSSCPTPTRS